MSDNNYYIEFSASSTPESVYNAIILEIDKWWTTSSNEAKHVGDILNVRFGGTTYKRMKVIRAIPNELLEWSVKEANIDHEGFTKKDEWVGTTIKWKIEESDAGSKIKFTHEGLVPAFECYEACQGGWNYFLGSLKDFLNTGKGTPHKETL